jgi:hypothetical protein
MMTETLKGSVQGSLLKKSINSDDTQKDKNVLGKPKEPVSFQYEDLTLETTLGRIYENSFDDFAKKPTPGFLGDEKETSIMITREDELIIKDTRDTFNTLDSTHKASVYRLTHGFSIFQHENQIGVKKIKDGEQRMRYTEMDNTLGMYIAEKKCLLASDKMKKFSIKINSRLLSTIASVASDINVSMSVLIRICLYYSVMKTDTQIPEKSRQYAKGKIETFDKYLYQSAVLAKYAPVMENEYIKLMSVDRSSRWEILEDSS